MKLWLLRALFLLLVVTPAARANDSMAPPATRARIHTELAAAYYSSGQLSIALQELKIAINADAYYAPAYNINGLIYMDLGENQQAQKNFERALSLRPENSDTQNNYGWFLCQHRNPKEAIPHFLAALKNPLYATPEKADYNIGICSLKLQKDKQAAMYFRRALQRQPRLALARYYLAGIAYRRGDYKTATSYFSLFIRQTPAPTAGQLWLGVKIERKTGNMNTEKTYSRMLHDRFPHVEESQALNDGKQP